MRFTGVVLARGAGGGLGSMARAWGGGRELARNRPIDWNVFHFCTASGYRVTGTTHTEVVMMHTFHAPSDTESAELVEETLIEEVSIDGMCGVY
ncbi:hypothetical protein GCM10027088_22870 [Nocardia goodfellowii]